MRLLNKIAGGFLAMMLPTAALAAEETAKGAEELPDPAMLWDHLWDEILIDITVIGVIFGIAAIWMMIKYKAKDPNDVGSLPKLSRAQALAWVFIPAAVFMADDFFLSAKGWTLWNVYRQVPENAIEIKVTGYQWYWEFDYGDGIVTEDLTVPVGQPVVLRMSAQDVIHSFFMPEYRVKEDVMPGRVTYIWFLPKKPGTTVATCTEFCGTAHGNMFTDVNALVPAEYDAWFAKAKAEASKG
jgi:cytochrome c oxidase subunit 2